MKTFKTVYRFDPVLFDVVRPPYFPVGTLVRKVQPHGCPRNGTMGQCYVEPVDPEVGTDFTMVCVKSLEVVK